VGHGAVGYSPVCEAVLFLEILWCDVSMERWSIGWPVIVGFGWPVPVGGQCGPWWPDSTGIVMLFDGFVGWRAAMGAAARMPGMKDAKAMAKGMFVENFMVVVCQGIA